MTDRIRNALVTGVILLLTCLGSYIFLPGHSGNKYRLDEIKTGQGWGYVIYRNNKPFIYQDNIPGISGRVSFRDEKTALQAGRLVLEKLRTGKNPAISQEEISMIIR
ncbi:MAG: DUF4907 domain-containing protein [Bacteroidales bacterium]